MIKRPLPIIGCTYLLSLAVVFCFHLGFTAALLAGGIVTAGVCAVCIIKRFSLNLLRVLLLSALAFSLGLLHASYKTVEVPRQVSAAYGHRAVVTATVLDRKGQRGSRYDYEIKTTSIALFNEQTGRYEDTSLPQQIKMRLTVTAPLDAVYYDALTTEVSVYPPYPLASSDPYVVQRADGICAFAYSYGDISYQSPAYYPPMAVLRTWRDRVNTAVAQAVGGEAGRVAAAMLTGQRGEVSPGVLASFRDSGISHMLAVSGMHTAILAQFLLLLLGLFKLPKRVCAMICMAFLILFVAFTGFTPSVVRAGIMACTLFSAQLFYRKNDAKNSVAFAALLLCGVNPAVLLDVGFLLSFAATLSILLLSPALDTLAERRLPWLWHHAKWAVQAATLSLAATLFTYPITAVVFGRVSLIGPVTNVLATPLAPVQMVSSLFTGLLGALSPDGLLTRLAAFITRISTLVIMRIAEVLARLDYAAASVNILWACLLAAVCVLLAVAVRALQRRYKHLKVLVIAAVLLLGGGVALGALQAEQDSIRVAFPNPALTATAVIHRGEAAVVLAGADTKKSASGAGYYLTSVGAGEVEALIVPYLNDASFTAAKDLLSRFEAGKMLLAHNSIRFEELAAAAPAYSELDTEAINTVTCLTDCRAQVVLQPKGGAVYIILQDTPFLFVYGTINAAYLPQHFKTAEVCVVSGGCPQGFGSITARYYVAADACVQANGEQFKGKSLLRADGDKPLVLSCSKGKTMRLEGGKVDVYG